MMERKAIGWILLAFAAGFLLASLTGQGGGFFGTGLMMGFMWFWVLVPAFLAAGAFLILAEHRAQHAKTMDEQAARP